MCRNAERGARARGVAIAACIHRPTPTHREISYTVHDLDAISSVDETGGRYRSSMPDSRLVDFSDTPGTVIRVFFVYIPSTFSMRTLRWWRHPGRSIGRTRYCAASAFLHTRQCLLSSLPPSSAASPPSRRKRSKYVFIRLARSSGVGVVFALERNGDAIRDIHAGGDTRARASRRRRSLKGALGTRFGGRPRRYFSDAFRARPVRVAAVAAMEARAIVHASARVKKSFSWRAFWFGWSLMSILWDD